MKGFSLVPSDLLLLAHSLSSFSDRLWDFGFPVLLAQANPARAVFVAALFSLSGQFSSFLLAAPLGLLLDRVQSRLQLVAVALFCQNGATLVLSLAVALLDHDGLLFSALIVIFSCVSTLASIAERVTITQEWAPLLLLGKNEVQRVEFNAHIRQVYLVTKICAPVVAGFAIGLLPSQFAALLFICGWNIISCVVELTLLTWVGSALPKKKKTLTPTKKADSKEVSTLGAIRIFVRHPMLLCSLSYALLYATVLCPGSLLHVHLMTTYHVGQGALASFQAACSTCGVIGTFLLVQFMALTKWGVVPSASAFLSFQVVCLWAACLSLWILELPSVFLALLALSRIGLWGFDVAHLQVMQTGLLASPHRNVIGTIQYGLCDVFSVIIAAPALIWSAPKDFPVLMGMSLFFVTASFAVFSMTRLKGTLDEKEKT